MQDIFPPMFQVILTLMGIISFIAIAYIGFRSRLPNETIKVQNESIIALQKAHDINNEQIKELQGKVSALEAENNLLKTLPLQELADTNKKVLDLLVTQNKILNSIHDLSVGGSTINVGKQ